MLCSKRNVILLIRYIFTHLRNEPCLVCTLSFLMWLQNEGNRLNTNSSLVVLFVLWNCCCLHRLVCGQKLKTYSIFPKNILLLKGTKNKKKKNTNQSNKTLRDVMWKKKREHLGTSAYCSKGMVYGLACSSEGTEFFSFSRKP